MHFVGMLAFEMGMPVVHGVGLTLLSFVVAVGSPGAAFAWVTQLGARPRDTLLSGPLMGTGVAAMHYTSMAAMRVSGNLAYDLPVVATSVLIAVTARAIGDDLAARGVRLQRAMAVTDSSCSQQSRASRR